MIKDIPLRSAKLSYGTPRCRMVLTLKRYAISEKTANSWKKNAVMPPAIQTVLELENLQGCENTAGKRCGVLAPFLHTCPAIGRSPLSEDGAGVDGP